MSKHKKKDIKEILKIIMIVLGIILILEVGFLVYARIKNEKNSVYVNTINNGKEVSDGYLTIGRSDFKYSHTNKFEKNGATKAVFTKYNKEYKMVFESKLDSEYNSSFYDVIEISDGYITVGEIQMTEYQNKNNTSEAVIVKYDKTGKSVWRKNFQVLDVSKFMKVKQDSEGNLVVVGQSLYEANVIGNHTTGGAIIAKYNSKGELLTSANYDGPKSGIYNDFIITEDGYIVIGKIKSSTGIIIKYNKELKMVWRKLYGNTDSLGLKSIVTLDNKSFLVTGSKMSSSKDSKNQTAVILKYSLTGQKLNEIEYKVKEINRYESIEVNNENIIATGVSSTIEDQSKVMSFINVYDKNLELIKESKIEQNAAFIISNIDNNTLFGYTNSKIKDIKSNGKDIFPIIMNISDEYELKYNTLK